MKHTLVIKRYAEALFEVAKESYLIEVIQSELNEVVKILKGSDDLKHLINHPSVTRIDKKELFETLFSKNINKLSLNFINLLIDKNRISLIEDITAEYSNLVNNLHKRVIAQVYTAMEVHDNTLDKLKKQLEEYLEKEVELETSVDKNIIGGILVKIGDRVIDGTLRTRFETIARSLN